MSPDPLGSGTWFDGRARLLTFTRQRDPRGVLLPIDVDQLPFPVRRIFTVADVPPGTVRGGHGHRRGWQLLLCVQGQIRVRMRCQAEQVELLLEDSGPGLLIGANIWAEQTYLHEPTVLLVACSEAFDPDAYYTDEPGAP